MKTVEELKYRADLAFARKSYSDANENYSAILANSPLSSKKNIGPLFRDVFDAKIR